MKEPYWITLQECLALHAIMISHYGGMDGLRDESLLESALAKPKHRFAYGNPDIGELAASYVAGVMKNHPFLDGNKRTGFMLGAGFLERNGYAFTAGEVDVVMQTLALAAGACTEEKYSAWLRAHSHKTRTEQ